MQIILDGKEISPPDPGVVNTTDELIKWLETNYIPQTCCLLELSINETPVSINGDLEKVAPLYTEINRVEAKSTNTRTLALNTLKEVKSYLQTLYSGLKNTAKLFREGQEQNAFELFQKCSEVMATIFPLLFTLDKILPIDFDTMTYNNEPIRIKIDSINKQFEKVNELTENGDINRLADFLDHELSCQIQDWYDISSQLIDETPQTNDLS